MKGRNAKHHKLNFKTLFSGIFLMTLLLGCSKEEEPGDSLAYEIILENSLSYYGEEEIPEQYIVFENQEDFNDFIPVIAAVHPEQAEDLRDLDVDFSKNNLIIIIGKYYLYCCSSIRVEGVYKTDEKILVKYEESGPGAATAISQAYVLLKVLKAE